MIRSMSGVSAIALAVLFGIGLAADAAAQDSGFLKDYSQLTVQTDKFGLTRRMWASPKFTGADLIPAAFVLRTVSQATGISSDQVQLAIESRITDSVSGEVLGLLVRNAKGIELPSNQNLSLSIVKSRIDEWAATAADSVAERLKAGRQ